MFDDRLPIHENSVSFDCEIHWVHRGESALCSCFEGDSSCCDGLDGGRCGQPDSWWLLIADAGYLLLMLMLIGILADSKPSVHLHQAVPSVTATALSHGA
jgi:hypothetical protein